MFSSKIVSILHYVVAVSVISIQCKCLQRTFDKVSVQFCTDDSCKEAIVTEGCLSGELLEDVMDNLTVRTPVSVLRRGAIKDVSMAKIVLRGLNVSDLHCNAFRNVTKASVIDLQLNDLKEIPYGVFTYMDVVRVYLTHNKISYVETEAFANMSRLRVMILRANKLNYFEKSWFINTTSITLLDLSYNRIENLEERAFTEMTHLRMLDLSFNALTKVPLSLCAPNSVLTYLDLVGNKISDISSSVFDGDFRVTYLKIALNQLSFLESKILDNLSTKKISLHPNPWFCPCLEVLENELYSHNVSTVADHRITLHSWVPLCTVTSNQMRTCGFSEDALESQNAKDNFLTVAQYENLVRKTIPIVIQ